MVLHSIAHFGGFVKGGRFFSKKQGGWEVRSLANPAATFQSIATAH